MKDDEEERLDEEELAALVDRPAKRKTKKQVADLGKGIKFELITVFTQKITPGGEIVEESETQTKLLVCGHQVSDTKVVKLCNYKDCIVCDQCIVLCKYRDCPNNCNTIGMCKNCAVEYEDDEGKTLYFCPDCANDYDLQQRKEKFLKPFKRLIGKKQE